MFISRATKRPTFSGTVLQYPMKSRIAKIDRIVTQIAGCVPHVSHWITFLKIKTHEIPCNQMEQFQRNCGKLDVMVPFSNDYIRLSREFQDSLYNCSSWNLWNLFFGSQLGECNNDYFQHGKYFEDDFAGCLNNFSIVLEVHTRNYSSSFGE